MLFYTQLAEHYQCSPYGRSSKGMISCTVVPSIGVLVMLNLPFISLMMLDDIDRPSPVPLPDSLVVKKAGGCNGCFVG